VVLLGNKTLEACDDNKSHYYTCVSVLCGLQGLQNWLIDSRLSQPSFGGPTVRRSGSKELVYRGSNHSTKRCKILLKTSILVAPLDVQQLKRFQLQGGFAPLTP